MSINPSYSVFLLHVKMATKATPTSAKTASHRVAIPPAPNINTINFTPKAKLMFCITIRRVNCPILIAVAIRAWLISLQYYIGCFNSNITAQSSHCYTYITHCQYRCIINTITNKGYIIGWIDFELFDMFVLSLQVVSRRKPV